MGGKHIRRDGERVYRKGRIRFFGGDERSLLHDIDEEAVLHAILKKRVQMNRLTGEVTVQREIDGHVLTFTQTQARSLLLHVKEVTA